MLGCYVTVNEGIIRKTADLLVSVGLKKAGYNHLVIDGMPYFL